MMKRLCVAMAMVAVVLSTASTAASKPKIPNLVGTWNGWVNCVGWNSGGFYYDTYWFDYKIQNEDLATGNFHGLRDAYYPFTGNVNTKKTVTIIEYGGAGDYRIITATTNGKTMSGTMQHFMSGQVDTGTFTFPKQ